MDTLSLFSSLRLVVVALLQFWRLPMHAVIRRFDETLGGSALTTATAVGALGMAMGDQASRQSLRLLGDTSVVALEYPGVGLDEFIPLMVAFVLAARVATGFAAEVALYQTEETLEAQSLFGLAPERTLLAPMGFACLVAGFCLGIEGAVVWLVSGAVLMYTRYDVAFLTFYRPDAISPVSLSWCIGKCILFGLLIFVAALVSGLRAYGGTDAVGRATTNAVVFSLLLCLGANVLADALRFLL